MRILIVHDRADVVTQLVSLIQSIGLSEHDIRIEKDGVGARSALEKDFFDLAVFDLTIPHIQGRGPTDYSTVDRLFEELFYTGGLNTPGDLIGVTREVDALDQIASKIGPHLMAIVGETQDDTWLTQLRDRMEYTMRSTAARQRSFNSRYDYDALIVTALDKELSPYAEAFTFTPIPRGAGLNEFLFRDRRGTMRRGLAFAIGRAGQASAASHTQALLTQYRPRLCLLSGFCGGIETKVSLGTVIIAETIVDWDYGKWREVDGGLVFSARPEPINIRDTPGHLIARNLVTNGITSKSSIESKIREVSGGRISEIKISLAPIASGSAVVAEKSIIDRIQGINEGIAGVDMEAYGFAFAANHTPVVKPQFLVVKSVADFCNKKKDDSLHTVCCFLSASVVEDILLKHWVFDENN